MVSDSGISALVYSADGAELIAADTSGVIHVIQRNDGKERLVDIANAAIWSLVFSPDGTELAAATDGTVALIEYPSCQPIRTFPQHLSWAEVVDFSPDGTMIACAGRQSGDVIVFTLAGDELFRLTNPSLIRTARFSPDGRTLLTASFDSSICLWDLAHREIRAELRGHDGWVTSLSFSPDGQTLASVSLDGAVRFWRAATPQEAARQRDELLSTITSSPRELATALGKPDD